MKKFLLAMIVLVLSAGAALSEGAGSPFIASLEEAVSSFDLNRNGYRVDLYAPGQNYSGTLQYDQGVAEIDLGEYGLVQLDPEKAAWLNGGAVYLLDYSRLSALFAENGDALLRAGYSIASKAMKHLVNPFVRYGYAGDTFSMHLDIDAGELRSQLGAFTADLVREEAVQAVYPLLASALRGGGAWFPENPEGLPDYILSLIPEDESLQGRLVGDLLVTYDGGAVSDVVFSGNFHYGYNGSKGTYPLYFELSLRDGQLSLCADGDIPGGGATLILGGGHFSFRTRGEAGGRPLISVDGTYDMATGEISADIRDGSGEKVGWISGVVQRDRLNLDFRCYYDSISLYARYGQKYLYVKANVNGRIYEAWAGETPDRGFSARIHGFNPVTWTDDACSFVGSRDRLDAELIRDGKRILDISAIHDPETGGFDVSGTLTDEYYGPYRARLAGAGTDYELEFSYPYNSWRVEGKGDIRFSSEYLLLSAVLNVNVSGGYTETSVYALELTEDTEERMVYRLSRDGEALWQLELGLPREAYGRAFTLQVLQGRDLVFAASLTPIAKERVTPFDLSNAVRITPEMIGMLVQTLTR